MRTLEHYEVRKILLDEANKARRRGVAAPLVGTIQLLAEAHEREIQRRLKEVDLADA